MRHAQAKEEFVPSADHADLAIAELADRETPSAETIDRFLASHEFPIVEGRYCTFVYQGEAHAVALRHWVYGLPTAAPFTRITGTDLWFYVLELPEGSRVEYKIEVRSGRHSNWIRDPLNPRIAHDPFGANSVCHGHGYETPPWIEHDPGAPQGSLEERVLQSEALGGRRHVTVYRPARFRASRRYPLLVVHDGRDYLRFARLQTVLDNLIHKLDVPGMIVALTQPPDRMEQYRDSAEHARYLAEELVPTLERDLPLIGTPASRGLMGASLGAVASLSTAIRYPGMFGRLLLQSGSFAFSDIGTHDRSPIFDPIAEMVNRYRAKPTAVSERVFVSCGTYESLIYENRSLVPMLRRTGMSVRFVEARDGHNWENWRDRLREGLAFLFPGPKWWVYY
ncbi:MAG: esterase [Gemmatimonas sp. SG8_23]|jgi:enterochelin esterase-like enzyme|nr:MAG: esterase [Gemmatimonas sp. SG8_23]